MPAILLSLIFNKYTLTVVLVGLVVFGIYEKGRMDVAAKQREAGLRAEIAILQRDRDIAKAAEADAAKKAEELAALTAQRDKEIADYAEELRARPDRCDLTPVDIDRLHGKAGKSK